MNVPVYHLDTRNGEGPYNSAKSGPCYRQRIENGLEDRRDPSRTSATAISASDSKYFLRMHDFNAKLSPASGTSFRKRANASLKGISRLSPKFEMEGREKRLISFNEPVYVSSTELSEASSKEEDSTSTIDEELLTESCKLPGRIKLFSSAGGCSKSCTEHKEIVANL